MSEVDYLYRVVVEPLWGTGDHKATYRRYEPPLNSMALPAKHALRWFDQELDGLAPGFTVKLQIAKR